MDILHSVMLGVVEGVTEFLPISSTGHLAIVAEWLHIPPSDFLTSFNIAIQLGAIAAAVVLYIRKIATRTALWGRLAVAFIPTAIIGVTLYSYIRPLVDNAWVASIALFVGGIVMVIVELWLAKKERTPDDERNHDDQGRLPSLRQSLYIGLYQVVAFVPGVSRSAATIIGGLIHGVSRKTSVEFSFLLAIPTMVAATGYDLLQSGSAFAADDWQVLLIGGVVSFITAFFAMKWLLRYVESHTFIPFGVYRMIVTIVFILVLII